MRQKKFRIKIKRLFILGAGASYSATLRRSMDALKTAPLDTGLCKRIDGLKPQKPHWVSKSRDLVVSSWQDDAEFTSFGLEQAVIRQLGHLEFIDAIHPRRRIGAVDSFQWLSHITHLMCYALRHAKENPHHIYRDFAAKLELDILPEKPVDRVVTFNYDDVLDGHLLAKYPCEQVYFDRFKKDADANDRRTTKHPFPMLVKLHGSVNWRCREKDFEKIIKGTQSEDGASWLEPVWLAPVGNPKPDDADYPLMVPPLPVKPVTTISLFRYLWTTAYEYLHEAEEIVVCGYSLPEADRLAWSLFGNFSNRALQRVTVIDPNPAIMSKWRTLFSRQSVGVARWEYYDDFGDYVRRLNS